MLLCSFFVLGHCDPSNLGLTLASMLSLAQCLTTVQGLPMFTGIDDWSRLPAPVGRE